MPRRDDIGEGLTYLGRDGGQLPVAGGEAGPEVVPVPRKTPYRAYSVIRKAQQDAANNAPVDITNYDLWREGDFVPCLRSQVPGAAYDIGGGVDVEDDRFITWAIEYTPPVSDNTNAHVLSVIMEVDIGGGLWRPYTMLDNTYTQQSLGGDATAPQRVNVASLFATRYAYPAEFRTPNLLAAATVVGPLLIPWTSRQGDVPPSTAPEPVHLHLTFDVTHFAAARLRWRHIQVDADGIFVANGEVTTPPASGAQDDAAPFPQPDDPNGFVDIHYATAV